jgi:hypothetical protein
VIWIEAEDYYVEVHARSGIHVDRWIVPVKPGA